MCLLNHYDLLNSIPLYYDSINNVFVDENGYMVWNLFEIITPNDLFLFKKTKEYTIVNHRTIRRTVVELYWPEEDDYYFDESICHDYSTMDLGDDEERIERYEQSKWSGDFI